MYLTHQGITRVAPFFPLLADEDVFSCQLHYLHEHRWLDFV